MKLPLSVRLSALILALALTASLLSSCGIGTAETVERTSFLFDTISTVKLRCSGDAEEVLSGAFELCEQYHRMFDRFDPESDIGRINAADGAACEVSEATAELITLALEYSRLSGGRYDITCGRVTGLWDFTAENPSLPSPDELLEALKTVGWEKVNVENRTVTVPAGTELDPGGIAKGYIADRIAGYLKEHGAEWAIINLGGNVRVLGDKDGRSFRVGVQSPSEASGTVGYLQVSDCSVVTAGSYQRCFTIGDSLYHHILDLSDGMPSRSDLASVTIICRDAVRADALATICFLLGTSDATELIESMEDTEAVLIDSSGVLRTTSGATAIFHTNE